jgi:glutamine phosphoribosylpyrophosphate amidotransferase
MCGIIGIISKKGKDCTTLLAELLIQSQIRGKHATGITYRDANGLFTIKEPIPATEFVAAVLPKDANIKCAIGHVRYSTSDLAFNQPLTEDNVSLVHNGVISQAAPESWEETFNLLGFKTRNDSEILLKEILNKQDPFRYTNRSMAAGVLTDKKMICFRNIYRPLYMFDNEDFAGFASTKDILLRAFDKLGITGYISKCKPNQFYIFKERGIWHTIPSQYEPTLRDQQYKVPITDKYLC